MAQLKIKQISDFISGVNAIHNGAAGTDTVSAISTAKSEAISQAVVNGDIAYDVNGAGAAAIAAAESKDVLRASTTATNLGTAVSNLESYADQAEADAKSYADGLASDYDASGDAAAAQSAAIASAESKDVLRAATAVTNIATAKSEAISQAVVNGDLAYDALGAANVQKLRIDAIVADADGALDTFVEIKTFVDELETADIVGLSSAISTAQSNAISAAESKDVLRAATAVTNIATAKSEAISQAVVNGDIAYDTKGDAAAAQSAAIASAESKDVVRATASQAYADQAEADAKSYADGLASDYDASGDAAAAQSAAIASAESKDVLRAATAVTNIATAKSEAISQAVVNGDLAYDALGAANVQKLRIDAIVADADGALDTFVEIKTFVDELETADIVGLSSAISTAQSNAISAAESKDVLRAATAVTNIATAKSEAISQAVVNGDIAYDTKGDAAAAQSAAIASAESKDVVRATASQAYADQAEADAIASAESKDVVRATASQSYTDQAAQDAAAAAGSYTDTREISILSVLRGELSAVAGTDILEQVAGFTNATSFRAPTQLSLVNNDILVFVNGLQVHKASEGVDGYSTANGQTFTVSGLGYDLESSDHIIVVGVAV